MGKLIFMSKNLENKLMSDFKFSIEIAKRKGFSSTAFIKMLEKHGAVKTAKSLLNTKELNKGFSRILNKKLTQHSMEAIVLRPEYKELFTEKELEVCRRRLGEIE